MINICIEKLDIIDSTNDYLIRLLDESKVDADKIVIAKEQTNGHGTNGRTFVSNKNVGLYFSFLHFYKNDIELKFLTQKVAVAIYETFFEIFGIDFSIKWVNDLYYNDKKICGILCKNLIKHKAVIIGVGIDLFFNKNIDESIKDIAGYIFENKKELVSSIKGNSFICSDIKNEFSYSNNLNEWDGSSLVIQMIEKIYKLINEKGLPKLYIEKNIIKDKKIYEDCNMEC